MVARIEQRQILTAMEKAITAGNLTDLVPEDLEVEAHTTLWEQSDPNELSLLKYLPSTPAYSVVHEYTKVTSYGVGTRKPSATGFFGEQSLPSETEWETERVTENIKLMGEIGSTFILASLEKTIRALNTEGAENIDQARLQLNVLRKKNRNLYQSDTSKTLLGDSGLRFRGLAQQIREGTDGTDGDASPYGAHVIDMEGQPLNLATLREKLAEAAVLFGMPTCLFMDPLTRAGLEASYDPAHRLATPASFAPIMMGQHVGGIQTQGGRMMFATDNTLSPIWYSGKYNTTLENGAPTATPTVVATQQALTQAESFFDADSAGDCVYVVTEVANEKEGLGTTTSTITQVAGQETELVLTPSSTTTESFRVYRTEPGVTTATEAWFIAEFPVVTRGAAITVYDVNEYRPNTSQAFALRILSKSAEAMGRPNQDGYLASYYGARSSASNYLVGNEKKGNTVGVAQLGPGMGVLELAAILATTRRPLLYSACTPLVRNPYQQWHFINIGRA